MTIENWDNIERMLNWGKKLDTVIYALKNNEPVEILPQDIEEGMFYLDHLNKYKSHNAEKNRDKEGEIFYQRIDEYISKLNNMF